MNDAIGSMLQTTQHMLKAVSKMPRKEGKRLIKDTEAITDYFVRKIQSSGDAETTRQILTAAELVLKTTVQTGIHDMDLMVGMYGSGHIYAYEKFCKLSAKARTDQKIASTLARIDRSTMSMDRIYRILDRYDEFTPVPMPDQMFDPAYDDEQVKAIWKSYISYVRCMEGSFDPMGLITADATPSAISGIMDTAVEIIGYGGDPSAFLSFPKDGNFEKHKFGHVISFIAMQNLQNPIQKCRGPRPRGHRHGYLRLFQGRLHAENAWGFFFCPFQASGKSEAVIP